MKKFIIPVKELEKIRNEAKEPLLKEIERLKEEVKRWVDTAKSHQQCARIFSDELVRLRKVIKKLEDEN